MDQLVRVKVTPLLISVALLLVFSIANLAVAIFGSFQAGDIIKGQKIIQERVTPLCLSAATRDACVRQINAAKRSVVVRLCKVVHDRLNLPHKECENVLAAAVKQNAAATAVGGRISPRAPPGAANQTPGANTERGIGAPRGRPGRGNPNVPPGRVVPEAVPGPQDQPGHSEDSNGKSSNLLPGLLPPGLRPPNPSDPGPGKAVGQAVEETGKAVGKVVEGVLGE